MRLTSSRHAVRCVVSLALVLSILGVSRAHAYVLPVTDVLNWVRNQVISLQTGWHVEVLNEQRRTVRKMARRLSEYIGDLRVRYAVRHDDPPRWRTHDFEGERYRYGRAYGAALNYGDAAGTAVTAINRPAPSIDQVPSLLAPAAYRHLQRAFATLDVADALLRDGTHVNGLIRYGGRRQIAATAAYELDALDGDFAQSMSAGLDKLNAAAVLALKQQQARNEMLTTALELALLDNKRRRDTEAVAMNQRLRAKQHYRAYASTFFSPAAGAAAETWRQP